MKTNAKEYLKEFAESQPDWLKFLIYEVIESNGNISDDKKLEVYNNLTIGSSLTINEPNINDNNSSEEIRIISLVHNEGVNALKQSQTINFQNDVTILYGLNGAGKSSYFKVLNEIVGGNQKKKVSSNIYLDNPTTIDVNISFKEKNKSIQTINWNGNTRSLDILNKCKVFDSSYLNGLLETRKADSTLIQPLGLNLFSSLVVLIDKFKRQLNDNADKKRLEKPTLELKYFQNEIKTSFENNQISNSIKTQIENLFDFTAESADNLIKVKKEIEDLKQINIQDKIKLKQSDKTEIESIKAYIDNTHKKLSEFRSNIKIELGLITKHKETNELAKKQFEILSTIPNSDNSEWKEFIKSGEKYTSKVEDSDKVCIYCRQTLRDENATGLIRAYGNYLKDESEQKLNNSIKSINQLKKNIETFSTSLIIKKNIEDILEKNKLEGNNESFYSLIIKTNTQFTVEREKLIEQIKIGNFKPENDLPTIKIITNKLNSISLSIKNEIYTLSDDNTKKVSRIEKLETSLKQLQENESISKQKENIKKWFEADVLENKIRKKASKINTRSITELSKQAHSQLLTEALKESFKEELSFLGYDNLKVKIENAQGGKGTSSTKLMLSKSNDIKTILSEGEQKAVVLALFIAEAKIQKSKNPIILDDPVNSLDHRIAGKFAQRLLKLENQVILFNHNRLFLDAFETSKENHICKTIDSDCNKSKGKHIRVYQVNSEGQNIKGVLRNYKSNKAKEHLSEIKKLLQNSPFEEELKTASLLRKTVECVIDEVVFNNQLPTKYSNKNSRIAWAELKKLKNDNEIIDKLENIHGRASGGEMHNGTENNENPIELEEFTTMVAEIEKIIS
ncbi:AAA family ATPase [Olleya namhaensis]|uniref:AAA family ATPase n=1 Tax=Olleya namhaensis TaxID=1144750 RepID=UPI00232E533B|nr:AAA family ATPase [Olleya namhaensis]